MAQTKTRRSGSSAGARNAGRGRPGWGHGHRLSHAVSAEEPFGNAVPSENPKCPDARERYTQVGGPRGAGGRQGDRQGRFPAWSGGRQHGSAEGGTKGEP